MIKRRLLLNGKITMELRRKIVKTLTSKAQGMFRWVAMSLETLQQIKFRPDFERDLGKLPSKLSDLYGIIHDQIDRSRQYERSAAMKTLKWLLCAQRLLSVKELAAAIPLLDEDTANSDSIVLADADEVTIDSSSDSEEQNELTSTWVTSPQDDIIRLCRNLVVLDTEQNVFRFAHQSVREYLLSRAEYTFVEQHASAAERCLDVYLAQAHPGFAESNEIVQNDIFKPYAMICWPIHYKYAEDLEAHELREKISRFMMQGSSTAPAYLQWVLDIKAQYRDAGSDRLMAGEINGSLGLGWADSLGTRLLIAAGERDPPNFLCAVCAFGFHILIKDFEPASIDWNQPLSRDREDSVEPYSSRTLLSIAAGEGHYQLVQLLLARGANINAPSKNGTALYTASYNGHASIVRMLLSNGANIDAKNLNDGCTALHSAAEKGHYSTVQMLLENGADINAQNEFHGTALHAASAQGHDSTVRMLLEKGADVNAQGRYHGTALHAASAGGHDSTVQLLLDHGVDINVQGGVYGTALHAAAAEGHDSIVSLLLEKGANIESPNKEGSIALHAAAARGYTSTVQMLL